MDAVTNGKGGNNEDKIRTILEILKKQIDQLDFTNGNAKSKEELTRSERIEKLAMEERNLSVQFGKIRKEIKRYERKYEKLLKKKVKLMKVQIKEDKHKLEAIKERYRELDTKVGVDPYKVGKPRNGKSKKVRNVIKVKTMKPRFRQKNIPLSKKIKIKIKRNKKLGRREMHFVNDGNGQNSFTDMVRMVKPMNVNTRECRIMLQRLTEEQMNRYASLKRLDQQRRKRKRVTRDSLKKVNQSGTATVKPNWHIKIPRAVFEESQKEVLSSNVASGSKDAV